MAGPKIITVTDTRTDNRVVLHERHPDHPDDGEAFCAAGAIVRVAMTPAVQAALRSGDLIEVPASADEEKAAKLAEKAREQAEIDANQAPGGSIATSPGNQTPASRGPGRPAGSGGSRG